MNPPPTTDYPAAHSTKTQWCAVDADGEDWRTLRSMPGREEEYAARYEQAQQRPDAWEGYHWTPPGEAAPP